MNVLRQTVDNLDAQRDQLVAAIERDYPATSEFCSACQSYLGFGHPTSGHRFDCPRDQAHRNLVPFAQACEHLVDAHNLLRDVVFVHEPRQNRHIYGPACCFRIPPMFGLDGDICGATATTRFTSAQDSWLQQFACADHRQPERQHLEDMHPGETIIEEDIKR